MAETKKNRIDRLRSAGIEVEDLVGKQFLNDKNFTDCIRDLQIQLDKNDLRPTERLMVLEYTLKYEKLQEAMKREKARMEAAGNKANAIGEGLLRKFGMMD